MAAAEQAAKKGDLSSGVVRICVDQGTDVVQNAGGLTIEIVPGRRVMHS